jgi:hypothetical protein
MMNPLRPFMGELEPRDVPLNPTNIDQLEQRGRRTPGAPQPGGGRPTARVRSSILVVVVALVALGGFPAAAPAGAAAPAPPGCGLSGGAQRQYFEPVGGTRSYPTNLAHRIGGRYADTTAQTFGAPIPPGTYHLVVGTYDSHHPGNPKHVTEQWRAEFLNGDTVVAQTGRTPDLPTSRKADAWDMGQITLSASATLVRAVHDPSDGTNHGFVPWFVEFRCAP